MLYSVGFKITRSKVVAKLLKAMEKPPKQLEDLEKGMPCKLFPIMNFYMLYYLDRSEVLKLLRVNKHVHDHIFGINSFCISQ